MPDLWSDRTNNVARRAPCSGSFLARIEHGAGAAMLLSIAPGRTILIDRMNVLLLYPEFPDTFWSFKHALKFIRKKAAFPPLGLLTVAAMLPPEWEKRLVDV